MANAGLYGGVGLVGPSAPGVVLQGPGARGALIGPDGSHISAAVAGGAVVAPPRPGGVVSAAIAPGHVAVGHGLGLGIGPVIAAPGLLGLGGIGLGHGGLHPLAAGSGLEGQWIPDINEHLYDDGSYRGEHGW